MERKLGLLLVCLVLTELAFSFTIFDPLENENTYFWDYDSDGEISYEYIEDVLKINGSASGSGTDFYLRSQLLMDYSEDINISVLFYMNDTSASLEGDNASTFEIYIGNENTSDLIFCAIDQWPDGRELAISNESDSNSVQVFGISGSINIFYNASNNSFSCAYTNETGDVFQLSIPVEINQDFTRMTLGAVVWEDVEGEGAPYGEIEVYLSDFEITFNGTDDCSFTTGAAWVINETVICEDKTFYSYHPILVLDQSESETTEFNSSVVAAFVLSGNATGLSYSTMFLDPTNPSQYTEDWDPDENAVFKVVMNETTHAIQIYSNFTSSDKFYSINLDDDDATGLQYPIVTIGTDLAFGYFQENAFIACFNSSEEGFDMINPSSGIFNSTICGAEVDQTYERTFSVSWNFSNVSDYQFVILINTSGGWVDKKTAAYDGSIKFTKFKSTPLIPEGLGKGNLTVDGVVLSVFDIFWVYGNLNVYDSLLNFSLSWNGSANFTWMPGSLVNINNSVLTGNSTENYWGFNIMNGEFHVNYSNFSYMGVNFDSNKFSGTGELVGNTFVHSGSWLVLGLNTGTYIRAISNNILSGTSNDFLFGSSGSINYNFNISNNIVAGWLGGVNTHNSVLFNNTAARLFVDGDSTGNAGVGPLVNVTIWNNNITNDIFDANATNYNQLKYSNGYGGIFWNITNITVGASLGLGNKIIIYDNLIGVDIEAYPLELFNLNQTAEITFYNLPWNAGVQLCANNSGSLENCYDCDAGNNCTYSSGTLVANVSHFSNYSTISNIVTRVVNTAPPACAEGTYNYETIQGAVDESSEGDLIIVCNDDPERQEEVNVDVAGLTIVGNESGTWISAIGADVNIFNITASNVTIANFTINGSSFAGGNVYSGITIRAVNATILNNNFTNNIVGITIYGANNSQIIGNNFVGNILPMVPLDVTSHNLNITSNNLFGVGSSVSHGIGDVSRGIDAGALYQTTISNNTISNFTYGIYLSSYGDSPDLSITNITGPNIIFNNTHGLWINSTNITVTGNLIENNTLVQLLYPDTVAIHLGEGSANITHGFNNLSGNQIIFNITNTSNFLSADNGWSYLEDYSFELSVIEGGIYVNKTSSPGTAPSGYTSLGRYINITNYTFANVSLYLKYTTEELGSIEESSLKIFKTNDGVTWTELTTSVDLVNHYAGAEDITEFSIFGLFGQEPITYLENFFDDFAGTVINESFYDILSYGLDVSQDDELIINGSGDVFGGLSTIGLVNTNRSFRISVDINLTNLTELTNRTEAMVVITDFNVESEFLYCSVFQNQTGYFLEVDKFDGSNITEVSTGNGTLVMEFDPSSNELYCSFGGITGLGDNISYGFDYTLFIGGSTYNDEMIVTFDNLNFSYYPAVVVSVDFPENDTYNSLILDLNFTVTGTPDSCWYSLDAGATNVSLPDCINDSLDASEGGNTVSVYANDSYGLIGSSSVSFTVDTVAPYLTIELPANTTYNTSTIELNFTVYDVTTAVDTCWYSNDSGVTNATLDSCNNISIEGYLDGAHTITVYANDSVNNINSSSRSFTIDVTPPWSNNVSNATILANQSGTINWILYDNIDEGYYYVERNGTVQNESTAWTNGTLIPVWINTTEPGIWNYTIHFNDSIGNSNANTVFIRIPQYPLVGNASTVSVEGISNLSISIIDSSDGTSDLLVLVFTNDSTRLMNVSHNFSSSGMNLSNMSIKLTSTYIIVNMAGNLLPGENKTVYLNDTGFTSLCVKDADVSSPSELSDTCTGAGETNFASCIGNSTGVTVDGMTCYDEGSVLRIEGMNHSAVWAIFPSPAVSLPSSSDFQKKKPVIDQYFNCKDGILEVNVSYGSAPIPGIAVYLFGNGEFGFSSLSETANESGSVRFRVDKNGTYELETASTSKYYKAVTSQFQLDLCPAQSRPLTDDSTNKTAINQSETEMPQNEIDLLQSGTDLKMLDAQSAIADAESQILTAEKDGKDVSEAINKLEQAKSAFGFGNYGEAQTLAYESLKLIKSAKETGIPKDVEPSDSQPKPADSTIWIIIGVLVAVVILAVLFLKLRGRK